MEISSSEKLYKSVLEKLNHKFLNEKSIIGGKVSCGNVSYKNEESIHEQNILLINKGERPQDQWQEIKRERYKVQDEWRIIFEGARSDGSLLGDVMNIDSKTMLGKFIESQRNEIEKNYFFNYEEFLGGFREIILDLGSLKTIAKILN